MTNKRVIVFTLLATALVSNVAWGKSVTTQLDNKSEQPLENNHKLEDKKPTFYNYDEVSGLIVDRTITRLGEDFYFFFSQTVNDRLDNMTENLEVRERPTALSGSIIGVYHSGKPIYRTALSPGRRQAKEKAEEAFNAVQNYIVRWQIDRLFSDTFDLDHDEF